MPRIQGTGDLLFGFVAPQARPSLPYLGGLDGLRALAVVAVVLYHGQDLTSLPQFLKPQAGFLGVEVFFVISGFLITALLLREYDERQKIDIKDFWMRRARRLLPALYVFLTGTFVMAALFATDAFDKLRREIIGALFYVSNWLQIATDESYFESAGRPSLLRHLWSLAIEEQFYLVWPLVVAAGLKWGGKKTLLVFTLAATAGATASLWLLFDQIPQYGDVTSVYYRTDARAGALLIGSALAMVWRPWQWGTGSSRLLQSTAFRWMIDLLGIAAVGVIVLLSYVLTDRVIEWDSYIALYHGGFLVLSATTCVAIAAVSTPASLLGKLLGIGPLRWIGTRSYGIYLWHWPVFQLTRPRLDVALDGYSLLALRLGIVVVLVELSYRLIETPFRQRRFVESMTGTIRTPRGIAVGTAVVLGLIASTTAVAVAVPTINRTSTTVVAASVAEAHDGATQTASTDPSPAEDDVSASAATGETASGLSGNNETGDRPVTPTPEPTPLSRSRVAIEAPTLVAGNFDEVEQVQAIPQPTPTQSPLAPPPPLSEPFDITTSQIHVIGDSVVGGAAGQLARISPRITIDSQVGRQWWQLESDIRSMRAQGLANDVVVIQMGNNGNFTTQMFDGVMSALSGTRLVLFVNIHAPVVWEAEVNAMLVSNVNRYPANARLIDWYSASAPNPEYFIEDGTHLAGPGMVAFRSLIANALVALG